VAKVYGGGFMSKRLLITGGGGFVGCHTLFHFLENTDWEIIVLDSFMHKGKTDRISAILKDKPEHWERVTVVAHNLIATISEQMVDRIGPVDYIINMASESHVDRSLKYPRDFINNNVNLMRTMIEYTIANPVKKFLHISTDEVFGPALEGYDHVEGDYLRPSNAYAASKGMQELDGYQSWRTDKLPYMQSNTMNIFGSLQDTEKLIPKAIKCAMKGEVMPIFATADGKAAGTRKYLHARNQADALLFILKNCEPVMYDHDQPENQPSRFNVVGDTEISNLDIALMVAKFAGKKLNYELIDFYRARPGHDARYSLDGTKMKKLGWVAPVPFEESLRETVEWTIKNPVWML
jgi:dTDP-glucose 4,6-dehydratase